MKIAMLSPFLPYRGGISQFSVMLYNELVKGNNCIKGFNFKRLYPDFLFPGKTQYVEKQSIEIETTRMLDSINPISYYKTVNALKVFEPDVLIISYWMSFFVPAYSYIVKRMKKRCKIILLIHNAIPHEPKFFDKPLAQLLFKQVDGFVILSENVAKGLNQLCPKAVSITLPHPLYDHFGDKVETVKAREALGIDSNKKTILFFGLIRDYKGLDLLIDAVSMLDDSYQCIIAGETYGSFDTYDEQIKKANHPERIKVFNRYISDNEVPLFFSAADVCVLPYRSATQSGITSIAYHFELPLIATNTGGLKESIEKPGAGLMVPEINATSIAETIRQFFRQDKNIFISNIQKEKAFLTWEHFAERLLSFAKEF
ncbi:MAG: glycosyltransferase [Tannerellaceae bacterium]|jgi:glycosyltransferase involved in cell wall biosynthesis|nr:glycosyltransferase [Tannerellaceae bacterium]